MLLRKKLITAGRELWAFRSTLILVGTPLLLLILLPFNEEMGMTRNACNCFYILIVMATYWCTEVIPLAVTSLLPLILVPLMGIQTTDQVARNYLKETNVLFLGGLIVAVAVEHSQLHKRIALSVLKIVGTNPRFLMLGFMAPTWFLSMWISNTATTAMMITIVQAVIFELEKHSANSQYTEDRSMVVVEETVSTCNSSNVHKFVLGNGEQQMKSTDGQWKKTAKALSISVAYAASAGGIATLTGTGPNLVFSENVNKYKEELNGYEFGLNFASWMGFAAPISITILLLSWIWLQIVFLGFSDCKQRQTVTEKAQIRHVIQSEYNKLGAVTWREVITLIHFVLLASLWLSRNPGRVGGWGSLFLPKHATDATAAIFVAVLLFMVPSSKPDFFCWRRLDEHEQRPARPREGLLTWSVVAHRLPWGLLLLLGGGFALADAIMKSELSEFIGEHLNFISSWPTWALVACLSAITATITEITSNVAISTFLLPLVGDMALHAGMNPLQTMIPVCLSCSLSYMLPVATPPNALVFSTGILAIKDMVITGSIMNVLGVLVVTMATIFWGDQMFSLIMESTRENMQSYNSVDSNTETVYNLARAQARATIETYGFPFIQCLD